jgi:CDP-diacylglycerol--serine O-phosphatidyltransferase
MEMKLKDYVTLGGLACGLLSIVALMFNRFDLASYMIVLAYVFDFLDGLVARLTKQFNKFGSELDNLCDMISCSIAPGFLIFYAFYNIADYPLWAAAAVMFLPVAAGTVRAARFNVRRAEFPGYFIGMPRTAFALIMVALLNSALFHSLGPLLSGYMYLVPLAIIVAISWEMVSLRPYVGHHNRKFTGWLRFGVWFWLLSIPLSFGLGWLLDYRSLIFDVVLFDLACYVFLAPLVLSKKEVRAYWEYIGKWKQMGEQ